MSPAINNEGIVEQSDNRTQAILSWQRTAAVDLRVEQDEQLRSLVLNGQLQSQMQRKHPTIPSYPHLLMLLEWLADKHWTHLLQLGLGGGEFSRALAARWPDRLVMSVEQEPLVIEAYQQFFRPQPHPNETLVCADAMVFSQETVAQGLQFDMVFVDIFPWPQHWQPLMQILMQLRAKKCWICINLPGKPPPQWQQFWDTMQVKLDCHPVPGYLNQLWLGA